MKACSAFRPDQRLYAITMSPRRYQRDQGMVTRLELLSDLNVAVVLHTGNPPAARLAQRCLFKHPDSQLGALAIGPAATVFLPEKRSARSSVSDVALLRHSMAHC